MQANTPDEIDEVVDENQAAAVVNQGERQRQPARREPHQRSEICLHFGTVDERRTQNDNLDPTFPRRSQQGALDSELASPVGITWIRKVGPAKRRSRRRGIAHCSDRAHMDQPAHSRFGRRPRQDPGRLRLVMISGFSPRAMRAAGEMNHDIDPVQMRRPVGPGADVTDRTKFDTRDRLCRTPGHPEHDMATLARGQGTAGGR